MESYRSRCTVCGYEWVWVGYKTGIGKTDAQLAEMRAAGRTCDRCGGEAHVDTNAPCPDCPGSNSRTFAGRYEKDAPRDYSCSRGHRWTETAGGAPKPKPPIDDNDEYRKSRDLAVAAQERARIVAWMRSYSQNRHAQEWADAIERRADTKGY